MEFGHVDDEQLSIEGLKFGIELKGRSSLSLEDQSSPLEHEIIQRFHQ